MIADTITTTIADPTEGIMIVTDATVMATMTITIMETTEAITTMQEDKNKIPLLRDFLFLVFLR